MDQQIDDQERKCKRSMIWRIYESKIAGAKVRVRNYRRKKVEVIEIVEFMIFVREQKCECGTMERKNSVMENFSFLFPHYGKRQKVGRPLRDG